MSHTLFAVYSRLPDPAALQVELETAGVSPADIWISMGSDLDLHGQ